MLFLGPDFAEHNLTGAPTPMPLPPVDISVFSLLEYSADGSYRKLSEVVMPTMSTVMIMKAHACNLYVGLLDGTLAMYSRKLGGDRVLCKVILVFKYNITEVVILQTENQLIELSNFLKLFG